MAGKAKKEVEADAEEKAADPAEQPSETGPILSIVIPRKPKRRRSSSSVARAKAAEITAEVAAGIAADEAAAAAEAAAVKRSSRKKGRKSKRNVDPHEDNEVAATVTQSSRKKGRKSKSSVDPHEDNEVAATVTQSSRKKGRKRASSADPPEDDEVADEIQPNKKNETATIEKSEAAMLRRKEDLLELSRQDAKQEFEAGRKRVMDQVPDAYKQMFGQAGFGKWGKHILPVLIMSPYDVSMGEGSPREQWLGMFERVSSLVRNH
jgi:hypothetical protein